MLDRRKIDAGDKVNATNIFNPSAEYIASRDHMTNFIFNMIQDYKVREAKRLYIFNSTLTSLHFVTSKLLIHFLVLYLALTRRILF